MAKGKTNQPVTIWVHGPWVDHPAVQALRDAGHRVVCLARSPLDGEPDWICHPAAGWHELFFTKDEKGGYPFVQARLKAERARRKRI